MNLKHIKYDLSRNKEVEVDKLSLEQVREFRQRYDVPSLESLALIVSGHRPLTRTSFSRELFYGWCIQNGIEWYDNGNSYVMRLKTPNRISKYSLSKRLKKINAWMVQFIRNSNYRPDTHPRFKMYQSMIESIQKNHPIL